ncbi:MAG TPA: DUF3658 domain-containing protein [Flavipsychrobacter sp.]|nr:DUF3658 domain-containing protein [Flavipsychrobacter sp.]
MIYHFVVGDHAAEALKAAVISETTLQGDVIMLKDILHVGPLRKEEGQSFSELRSSYWQQILPNEKSPVQVDDMERLLAVSGEMYKDSNIQAWFWMAPSPADVCAYYWVLPYLSKHLGRFYILNISGLPFLDEQGKLFYPKSISHILPKELVKARKLARQVTPSEMEVDSDEWIKLVEENAPLRTHEGGKKIQSRSEDFYDSQLMSFCSQQFQKASKIVRQTLAKYSVPTGDIWLGWRLRKLVMEEKLAAQGDTSKALNEFDVKLPGEIILSSQTETA